MFGSTGFGQQQKPQTAFGQSTGGFSGFGAQQTTSAFGQPAQQQQQQQQQQPTSIFGQQQPSTAFGQPSSAFGTTTSTFGQQPKTFGSTTTTSGIFGSQPTQPAASGFGGFGQPATASIGFGQPAAATGAGIFGQKPAFGAAPTNTGFGSNTGTMFGGAQQTTSAFGSSISPNNGTGNPSFSAYQEKEANASTTSNFYSISAMPSYRNFSFEELRLQDYSLNKNPLKSGSGFGQSTGGFGAQQSTSAFGQPNPASGSGFGAAATTTAPAFGQSTQAGFGTGSSFGTTQPSGFGTSTSPFGRPAVSTAFGQTAPAASGFGAPVQQAAPAFGQSTANAGIGGGFGTPAAASTGFNFGAPSNTTTTGFGAKPSTGFGGFGIVFNMCTFYSGLTIDVGTQQAPPVSTGTGFGTGTSLFGGPSTTGFGAAGANTGFGNAPAPAFGAIGTSTAPTMPSFGATPGQPSMFQSTAPSAGTNAFGAPSTSKPGGLFGNTANPTPAPSIFGANTGTSLFPTTSTAAPATSTAPAFSFGAQSNTGGLFGNKPASTAPTFPSFGSTAMSKPAGTTTLGTSLFGSTSQPQSTTLGGGFTGFGSSTSTLPSGPTLQASVDQNPYGNNPLFSTSTLPPSGVRSNTILAPKTPSVEKIKSAVTPHYKLNPRSSSKIKLRGFTPAMGNSNASKTPGKVSLHLFDGGNTEKILTPEIFVPRQSSKKIYALSKNVEEEPTDATPIRHLFTPSKAEMTNLLSPSVRKVTFGAVTETPSSSGNLLDRMMFSSPEANSLATKSSLNLESPLISKKAEIETKKNIEKEPGKYWMSPSIEELCQMTEQQLTKVKNFTVGLPGVGTLRYLEPVDLTNLPVPISKICNHLVIIEPKACTVYPDDSVKPPQGQGLNVPAEVTLYNCWPVDKATQTFVKDQTDRRFKNHLDRMKNKVDAKFISYEFETGEWKFEVQHFSRYALDDDSDEDAENIENNPSSAVNALQPENSEVLDEPTKESTKEVVKPFISRVEADPRRIASMRSTLFQKPSSSHLDIKSSLILDSSSPSRKSHIPNNLLKRHKSSNKELEFSPSKVFQVTKKIELKQGPLVTSHSVLEEKSNDQIMEGDEESMELVKEMPTHQNLKDGIVNPSKVDFYPMTLQQLRQIDYSKSYRHRREKCLKDAGLFMGKSCGLAWSNDGKIYHCGKIYSNVKKMSENMDPPETGIVVVQEIQPFQKGDSNSKITEIAKQKCTLQVQLQHTVINRDEAGIPYCQMEPSLCYKHFAKMAKSQPGFNQEERMIWELASAIWDELPVPRYWNQLHDKEKEITVHMMRKAKISEWLQHSVTNDIQRKVELLLERPVSSEREKAERTFEVIFHYLSGCQVQEACHSALESKNLRLATLLSQFGGKEFLGSSTGLGDNVFREGLTSQMETWMKSGMKPKQGDASSFLPYHFWKIVQVLAGKIFSSHLPEKHQLEVDVYEGLSWKQCLGLCLWFGHQKAVSFSLVLESYRTMFQNPEGKVSLPLPSYFSPSARTSGNFPKCDHFDMSYHLLSLFCQANSTLEAALSPYTFTSNGLDYRMTWVLALLLGTKGKAFFKDHQHVVEMGGIGDHVSESEPFHSFTKDSVCLKFAFQLESLGLWEWAIFAVEYMSTATSREKAIRDILYRHVPYDNLKTSLPFEICVKLDFIVNSLKVPKAWISEAKSIRSRYHNDKRSEIHHLLDANLFHQAHLLLMSHVGPKLVMSNRIKELETLVSKFDVSQVDNWSIQGKVYQEYVECIKAAPVLLKQVGMEPTDVDIDIEYEVHDITVKLRSIISITVNLDNDNTTLWQRACYSKMSCAALKMLQQLHSEEEEEQMLMRASFIPEDVRISNIFNLCQEYFGSNRETSVA